MLDFLTGILGGLGGLFGKKSSQSFDQWTDSETEAESQDLSPELLKALEGLFMNQIGSGKFEQSTDALSTRLGQLMDQSKMPMFDPETYAKGIRDQATAGAQLDLESSINGMLSSSGVSEGGNSMNALIANKMKNTTAANLGGVFSQAYGEGEQIRQSQQSLLNEGISGMSGSLMQGLLGLIGATRGAYQKGKSKTKEHTWGTSKTKSGGGLGDFLGGFGDFFNIGKE